MFYKKLLLSKELVEGATPYAKQSQDYSTSLLIIGDSTQVGVGAERPEDTVGGRFAEAHNITYVENHAVSGARLDDMGEQIENTKQDSFTYIILQVGANDIIRFMGVDKAEERLRTTLSGLPKHQTLVVMLAGNVGGTNFFPPFLNPFYTKLNMKYHAMYEKVAPEFGGTYVNLYVPKEEDPFIQNPDTYFAPDGLHPSSEGYKLWFEKMMRAVSI